MTENYLKIRRGSIVEGLRGLDMVYTNNFKILDEGKIKCVDTINMTTHTKLLKDYVLEYEFKTRHNDEYNILSTRLRDLDVRKKYIDHVAETDIYHQHFDELDDIANEKREILRRFQRLEYVEMKHPDEMSKEDLFRHYGKEIFNPCIMINISPNWKGKLPREEYKFANKFIDVVMKRFYNDSNRFSKMKYVIECGKDGDFVHLHSVLELNVAMRNSNKSWIKKGNHLRDLRNIWKKTCLEFEDFNDYQNALKGRFALQNTLLNCNELIRDKLNYLIEELKPISHQNSDESPQHPHIVNKGFD